MKINGKDCSDNDYFVYKVCNYDGYIKLIHCNTLRLVRYDCKDFFAIADSINIINMNVCDILTCGDQYFSIKSISGGISDYIVYYEGEEVLVWYNGLCYKLPKPIAGISVTIDSENYLRIEYFLSTNLYPTISYVISDKVSERIDSNNFMSRRISSLTGNVVTRSVFMRNILFS